ncbi:MAG: hypothetical protein RLZZ628_930 [Bacteroidota bacterium]|jgi:hypothetical protein
MIRYNMPGPIDLPQETNSGLDLLPTNTTCMVLPLSKNGPRQPEEIPEDRRGSVGQVMDYVQPTVKVGLATGNPNNPTQNAEITFTGGIESFSTKSLKNRIPLLRKLQSEIAISDGLIARIEQNAQFRKALDNPQARAAMIALLNDIIGELDETLPADAAG